MTSICATTGVDSNAVFSGLTSAGGFFWTLG